MRSFWRRYPGVKLKLFQAQSDYKTVAAIYTGKEVFKHLVADVYNTISTKTKAKYKQWDTEKK